MAKSVSILGIAGSLRKEAYSKAALHAAAELVPPHVTLETFDIRTIPPFNQDHEADPPEVVRHLKEKVRSSDAILFVTPEYNYSVPGVLKNAIDWASRPYGDSAWEGKPVGIMSSSTGMLGGARAQYQLRQVFVFLNMHPLNRPEVMIPFAPEKFDEKGELIDHHSRDKIRELLVTLVEWTIQLREGKDEAAVRHVQFHYGTKGGKQKK